MLVSRSGIFFFNEAAKKHRHAETGLNLLAPVKESCNTASSKNPVNTVVCFVATVKEKKHMVRVWYSGAHIPLDTL